MKTMITALLLTLASTQAFAAPIFCRGKNTGPDHGIYAQISSDRRQADITTQSIGGPRTIAQLVCAKAVRRTPDFGGRVTLLSCSEPVLRDAGFALQLKRGNGVGNYKANLYRVTIAGRELMETMSCVAAMN